MLPRANYLPAMCYILITSLLARLGTFFCSTSYQFDHDLVLVPDGCSV